MILLTRRVKDMAREIFYDVYIVRLAHTKILFVSG